MGGKPDASAPYPDDLFRLHHGCVAARLLARSRSRNAPRHRRRRIFGNARRHLLRPRPDACLLRADAKAIGKLGALNLYPPIHNMNPAIRRRRELHIVRHGHHRPVLAVR